jgi:acetylornithine deacetylase
MILNDGGTAANVFAACTQCTLTIRTMPEDHHREALELIIERAEAYNLEVSWRGSGPFYIAPDAPVVQVALAATGLPTAQTVPFGTEALVYQEYTQPVVLGPGNIAQAHTVGEYIDVAQLQQAVDVYSRMIEQVCL